MSALSLSHKERPLLVPVTLTAGSIVLLGIISSQLKFGGDFSPWALPILAALILAAELLPVRLSTLRLRVTVSLPFVATLAITHGPIVSLGVEILVSWASLLWLSHRSREMIDRTRFLLNMIVATAGALAGTLLLFAALQLPVQGAIESCVLASAYAVGSLLGGHFCLQYLVRRFGWVGRGFGGALPPSITFIVTATLVLISAPGPIFARPEYVFLLPVLFWPILCMRAALQYKSQIMAHYHETIVALMLMLQRAHPYSHGHLERVASLAERVALRIGLSSQRARMVREAAILHDIGKIAIDEEVLDKPAKLTEEEFAHVKQHSEFGALILSECDTFSSFVEWIRHHHERIDGNGYPAGLAGDSIPIESRIIAVTDAFDAMVGGGLPGEKRTYREPMSFEEALQELERCSGTQFDGEVVLAFKETVLEGY